jgi:trimeric autotransporter adhesin
LGSSAGINLTTGSNNIEIGNIGVAGEANTIRLGAVGTQTATFVAGIAGVPISGRPVAVNSSGQLGIKPSSRRYKEAITPIDRASEAILALQPVSFRYKKELDPEGVPQFGLVAEDVAKVSPDLVTTDGQGKPFTVRYEEVNAMLLNEFLKEHRKVEELEATAVEQRKAIQALTAGLKEEGAQIQRLSAELEVSKPAPQTVDNNQ